MERAEIKQAFLIQAIAEGAHKIIPKGLTPDQWAIRRNIGGVYAASPATYQDLANQYGLTRARIGQLNEGFLKGLWLNCSVETQNRFPLEEIPVGKPLSVRWRERIDRDKTSLTSKIAKLLESGVTDKDQIALATGASNLAISNKRTALQRRGFTLPRSNISYQNLEKRITEEDDDKKLQQILDEMSDASITHFMHWQAVIKQIQQPLFISLGNMLRQAGYHFKSNKLELFAQVLQEQNIPFRKAIPVVQKHKGIEVPLVYYIVLNKRKAEVLEVINNTPDLQHFKKSPVQLVFGPTDTLLPTTTEVVFRKGYAAVQKHIMQATGLRAGSRSRLKVEEFLTGCPVPIFKLKDTYVVPSDRIKELQAFLKEKYK